jgi:hypothetical protein
VCVPDAESVASLTQDFDGTPLNSVDQEIFAISEDHITVDSSKVSEGEQRELFVRFKNEDTGHLWIRKLFFAAEAPKCIAE